MDAEAYQQLLDSPASAPARLRGVTRYTSATDADRREMLAEIGVESIDDLFEQIPEAVRLGRPLELPDGLSETEVYERSRRLAARNADAESEVCFLGAGMYDHYVPAIVDAITQRSEFLTPYTPYQPEISQGGLQVMFEFQTAMSELTALPVSQRRSLRGPLVGRLRRLPGDGARPSAAASSSRAGCTRTAARPLPPTRRATAPRSVEVGLDGRPDRRERAGRGRRRRNRRGLPAEPQLPRRRRGRRGASARPPARTARS